MHKVTVSPELLKRGRKSGGPNPLGDMVSIRYGFHPDSLDHKSKMQLEEDKDKGNWVLRGSGGNGTHTFSGGVAPASDLECVLVWDAPSNSYVLHPLDATLRVSRDKAAGAGTVGASRATRTASPESTDGLGISLPGAGKIVSEEELRKKREIEAREAKEAAAAKAQAAEEAAEAARLEAELMEADMGLEEVEDVKPEPVKKAPAKKAPAKKTAPKKAAPKPVAKPAAKRPPTSTPTAAASSSESDVDADLDDFGDLANELEESLEQFSKDDDGDVMMIVDDSHDNKPKHSWNMPAGGGGPMSLRGYAGGRREEEELSSSEEE
ncbi:YALIA101S01e27930g1_1 [Yarrowia lipolytica]|nr:Hypothetical protein YALI2_C01174g [Yarrowia lipolytica]SEI31624.1 YALIA101S01e27930g1_1 [Yarrowia lipolytica]VBB84945.1 Hypothetical protein conserved in the Yarrowia clade [Yarrowia lipolytica]